MEQLIIIRTNKAEKIKGFLDQEKQNYKVFNQTQRKKDLFANYGETIKDKEREKEAQELENAEEEDIVNEECKKFDKVYPFEIFIDFQGKKGKALPDQIKTYSHGRIIKKYGVLDPKYYPEVEKKVKEERVKGYVGEEN
ncbi:12294_t:CDS:2 [Entrophospora sp. SA101]|nr:12294_t:CDS:2 [Entrophospora sp. SA101]